MNLLKWTSAKEPTYSPATQTRVRLGYAMTIFGVVFAVLFARLLDVTMLRESFDRRVVRTPDASVYYRADIVDRNGEILATDLQGASLYADARVIWDPQETAQELKQVIPTLDAAAIARKLNSRQAFVWIKRNVSPAQQRAIKQLGAPGLHLRQEPRRVYPNGRTSAHVLGYVDVDNHGLAGLERGVEDLILERRNKGTLVESSIDLRVQHALEDEVASAVASYKATGAAGIIMDVRNGEVLALSSFPTFDPNEPGRATADALFNRVSLGVYEMGSTFKTFSIAAALDTNKATTKSTYDVREPILAGAHTISDSHPENRILSLAEVFGLSSNIGTAKIALEMGIDIERAYFAKFGLTLPMQSEIKELGAPLLPKRWGELELMTVSYGHGIAVTPLHVAAAMASVVNGGRLMRPTLLKRADGETIPHTRVISEATSAQMRRLLRLAVTHGTGGKADVPGYPVAGKTGTAEKVSGRDYAPKSLLTSFAGTFPAASPQYVVLIILDEPQPASETFGQAAAGWTAAPTVGKVIARIAPMLNVPVTPIDPRDASGTTMASFEDLHP